MSKDLNFNSFLLSHSCHNEIEKDYLIDEDKIVKRILQAYDANFPERKINQLSRYLIQYTRNNHSAFGLEQFLQEYPLSSAEGGILMSLAEALLRIPDADTALQLTREQLSQGEWAEHIQSQPSWLINLSTWSVHLSNKFLNQSQQFHKNADNQALERLARLGEHTVIKAVRQAISILGRQFVMAENISTALDKSQSLTQQGYRLTYDMLGEAALSQAESQCYLEKYMQAIEDIGKNAKISCIDASISVKLSALHPRFEHLQQAHCHSQLFAAMKQLCVSAQKYAVSIVIDAEESERLDMSLAIFTQLIQDPQLKHWEQLGIAVQSYQKRAPAVIDYLLALAKAAQKRIYIRLVKGAYWDYEIKQAQQNGWSDYPVFTNKVNTELCYLYCAQKLFKQSQYCFPQFASHNAQTIASIYYYAQKMRCSDYEFQQLYGMGDTIYQGLYTWMANHEQLAIPCSIYAPVGRQQTLLPYLVRRLIENGANNSFVNQVYNHRIAAEKICLDMAAYYRNRQTYRHPTIPTAAQLFPGRRNSHGLNLASSKQLQDLAMALETFSQSADGDKTHASKAGSDKFYEIKPLIAAPCRFKEFITINNPSTLKALGKCYLADQAACVKAIDVAVQVRQRWQKTMLEHRAELLNALADQLEQHHTELLWLLINEAGKVLSDAHNEIREAVDFCRYYAQLGVKIMAKAERLNSYTGEENSLLLEGRGVFLCISPWNFPLAIFTGQIAAALITGNCVLAKPASHTPLIAYRVVELFYQAGFGIDVLQLLPARVDTIRQAVLTHPRLSAVAFTGSHAAAVDINRVLANRRGAILPLIAETGGVNAMLADSSALSEQLVRDMLLSAFGSSGQRCSALRVAFIQEDIYAHTWQQLCAAMQELVLANPMDFSADLGPLITVSEAAKVSAHIETMRQQGRRIFSAGRQLIEGPNFIQPTLIELDNLVSLKQEIFGPVLHLIPYQANELEMLIDSINATGFGLTFGVHSRIPSRIRRLAEQVEVGNVYINRNIIGAIVGVQPFGGRGLSGTGPKAGGPHYLQGFCHEKTMTFNSTSIGANLSLLNS